MFVSASSSPSVGRPFSATPPATALMAPGIPLGISGLREAAEAMPGSTMTRPALSARAVSRGASGSWARTSNAAASIQLVYTSLSTTDQVILFATTFVAGLLNATVGGGGLLQLPMLMLLV